MSCNKDSSILILINLRLSIVNSDDIYNTCVYLDLCPIPMIGVGNLFDVNGQKINIHFSRSPTRIFIPTLFYFKQKSIIISNLVYPSS